jgi:hypothetical protein
MLGVKPLKLGSCCCQLAFTGKLTQGPGCLRRSWENQDEGFIAKLLVPEGTQGVAVGSPVAVLVEEEGAVPAFKGYAAGGGSEAAAAPAAAEAPEQAAPAAAAAAAGKGEAYYAALPPHAVCASGGATPSAGGVGFGVLVLGRVGGCTCLGGGKPGSEGDF